MVRKGGRGKRRGGEGDAEWREVAECSMGGGRGFCSLGCGLGLGALLFSSGA